MDDSVKCFCDASFDPKTKVAVIGWKVAQSPIETKIIRDVTNTLAEYEAILCLIRDLPSGRRYVIYTDCMGAIDKIRIMKEGIFDIKMSQKLGDVGDRLFGCLTDEMEFRHIRGHIPKAQKTEDDVIFSTIDKRVRKELRRFVKENR